jgi:hypothetical protein
VIDLFSDSLCNETNPLSLEPKYSTLLIKKESSFSSTNLQPPLLPVLSILMLAYYFLGRVSGSFPRDFLTKRLYMFITPHPTHMTESS